MSESGASRSFGTAKTSPQLCVVQDAAGASISCLGLTLIGRASVSRERRSECGEFGICCTTLRF
jgi:hypothetical protein